MPNATPMVGTRDPGDPEYTCRDALLGAVLDLIDREEETNGGILPSSIRVEIAALLVSWACDANGDPVCPTCKDAPGARDGGAVCPGCDA